MPFNRKPQKFNAAIKSVVIGSGDKTVTLGGENVLPFYAFDGEIKNGPKVGVEITDLGMEGEPESVKAYYEGAATMGEIAKKAAAMEGADFLCLRLAGGDPNGLNKSVEELIETVKEVADAGIQAQVFGQLIVTADTHDGIRADLSVGHRIFLFADVSVFSGLLAAVHRPAYVG